MVTGILSCRCAVQTPSPVPTNCSTASTYSTSRRLARFRHNNRNLLCSARYALLSGILFRSETTFGAYRINNIVFFHSSSTLPLVKDISQTTCRRPKRFTPRRNKKKRSIRPKLWHEHDCYISPQKDYLRIPNNSRTK